MNGFIFGLFIKEPLIKTFHERINGFIGKLDASDKIMTLFDPCLFDWRIVLNISDREISVKYFIISLFSE